MSQPTRANLSSPIYYAYTYTAPQKGQSDDEIYSLANSCYSSNSRCSVSQSLTSSQRINQLKPKSKIPISKCSTLANTKKKSETEVSSPTKLSITSPAYSRRSETIITQSIEYSTIRPFFNWNKFSLLCGVGPQKMGQNGCQCGEECPWKREWIKGGEGSDLKAFQKLLREKPTPENVQQIEKDLPRTHPECPTFSTNPYFRSMLRKVLIAYSIYDMEMGYVQGVNMIAGVLLYHIKHQSLTFWALVELMDNQQLRLVYLDSFTHLRAHCERIKQILSEKVQDLYWHMEELQIVSDCFLNGWLLSLMSTSIPMEYMHEVLDQFRKKGWKYMYQIIVTYLLFLKEVLLTSRDEAEFLISLNTQHSRELGIHWVEMIRSASKLPL